MAVRRAVFIKEQAVPEEEEWDAEDASAEHFIAVSAKRDVVGVGRLQDDAKITRMAVLSEWRGHRIGALLLESMLQRAIGRGMNPWLHAQAHAVDFYRRFGFEAVGEPFDEAGIAHILMRRPPGSD
ncbi:MAG: GNAT family N-acetyltransferase [Pseudomonadota bacterium]